VINGVRIAGWGKYLPEKVLTNGDLERMMDTSDEWIVSRTGIKERRIAGKHETASSMAAEASQAALSVAGADPSTLDLIIVATTTPDMMFPASASLVQESLSAPRAGAFDLNAACSGFVYALAVGHQFIAAGTYRRVLVVGSEVYSRIMDWEDRGTCVLFGDGAGAVLLEATSLHNGPCSIVLGSDGAGAEMLFVPGPCGPGDSGKHQPYLLQMKGPEVFRFAVNIMVKAAKEAAQGAGLGLDEIDLFIPHQANKRIINAAARTLKMSPERVFMNLESYGNTSAASVPIALCEAAEQGRIEEGDKVLMVGFGGGLSWAAMTLEWHP
jgi:3-oxoacyl-[acyl-carrier-protein] synthase-3